MPDILDSCPAEPVIAALHAGALSPADRESVLRHAAGCPACQAQLGAAAAPSAPAPSAPAQRLAHGALVHRYEIIDCLGQGGMGVVYQAIDRSLRRPVALKMLRDDKTGPSQEERARMLREAQTMAQVAHDNVVAIYDIGVHEGQPFLVMELLTGGSLRDLLRARQEAGQPLPVPTVLHIARQLSAALGTAHQLGIIHRDLKPANILMAPPRPPTEDERVKVSDFGLARWSAPTASLIPAGVEGEDTALRTTSGVFVGTPAYASPEQCRGLAVDGKADVYALGVLLYEMLSNLRPFVGAPLEILSQHLSAAPIPLLEVAPSVPPALAALVHDLLQKRPEDRPTMAEVQERLAALPTPPPTAARARRPWNRRGLLGAALLTAGLAAGLAALAVRRPSAMVYVPGGTFEMGSSASAIDSAFSWCERVAKIDGDPCDRAIFEREQPVRTVKISPFYLDTTEVTFARFASWLNQLSGLRVEVQGTEPWVMLGPTRLANIYPTYYPSYGLVEKQGRFSALAEFADQPVTKVTWDGARLYCQAQGKRLPTEAEWEFAARGPEGFAFPWGNEEPRCDGVAFGRRKGDGCEHMPVHRPPVGTSPQDRTPLGVLDLGGSASEWVMDRFEERYRPCPQPCVDPVVEDGAGPLLRVFRGGTFSLAAPMLRSAGRYRRAQNDTMRELGFRCARPAR